MKNRTLQFSLIILAFFLCYRSQAQKITITSSSPDTVYLQDDFNIVGDSLTDEGNGLSGSGWAGEWAYDGIPSSLTAVNRASLSFPSSCHLMVSGKSIKAAHINTLERFFSNTYELSNTIFYLSFLARKNAAGAFSLEGYAGTYLRYGMSVDASGVVRVRAGANWSSGSSSGTFVNDSTYLIVLLKDKDESKVAIFKDGDAIPADTSSVSWVTSETGVSGLDLDKFQFVISGAEVEIDEVKLGSTWSSVTGSSTVSTTVTSRNPELKWGAENDIDFYNIQLATDSAFTSVVLDDTVSALVSRFVPRDELDYGDYFWRIRGSSSGGLSWGSWRNYHALSIEENDSVVQIYLTDPLSTIRSKVISATTNQKILLESGTYSFSASDVGSIDYLFKLNNKKQVEIDGNGSTIILKSDVGNVGLFTADRSSDISLRNLKVIREKKLHLPLKVVEVDTSDLSLVCERVSSEYPLPSEEPVQYENATESLWVLDSATLKIKYGTTLSVKTDADLSGIHDGTKWKYYFNSSYPNREYVINNISPGDICLSGQKFGNRKDVNLTNCTNVTIYNLDLDNTGNTFAIYGEKCASVNVLNCDFPRDTYQGPVSDGIHFKDLRGGTWIEGNVIESNGDDIIAIRPKNRSLTYVNASTMNVSIYDDIEVGDELHFVENSAFNYLYEAGVAQVNDAGSYKEIVLDAPVLTLDATDYNNFTLAGPHTMIRGNTFRGNRGDAFHLCINQSVIENNTVKDLGERVFTITPSEGGGTYSRDVLIRNNEFVNVKRFDDLSEVDGSFLVIKFGSSEFKKHRNIVFEKNNCFGYPNMAFSIENASGVYVRDNHVSSGANIDTTIDFYGDIVKVENTDNIFFENNTFVEFRNRPSADYLTSTASSDFATNNPYFNDQFIAKTWTEDKIGHSQSITTEMGREVPHRSLTYLSLTGAGKIDGNSSSDILSFVNVDVSGDTESAMKVDSLIVPSSVNFARAGLMIRDDVGIGSRYAMISVREYNGHYYLQHISRSTASTSLTVGETSGIISFPIYIKLVRKGTDVTSYYSYDDQSWVEFHQETLELNASYLAGVAITSQDTTQMSTLLGDELHIIDYPELGSPNHRKESEEASGEEVKEKQNQTMNLWPNPAYKSFFVNFKGCKSGTGSVEVLDLSGRLILFGQIEVSEHRTEVDVSGLISGMYVVRTVLPNGQTLSRRLIVD